MGGGFGEEDWGRRIGGRELLKEDWRIGRRVLGKGGLGKKTGRNGLGTEDWRNRTGGRGLVEEDWQKSTRRKYK